jgi:hypothetical protein
MAVRTEQSEVFESIIVPFSVEMIELKRNGTSVPSLSEAILASGLLQAFTNESSLQTVRGARPTCHEDLRKRLWCDDWSGDSTSPT